MNGNQAATIAVPRRSIAFGLRLDGFPTIPFLILATTASPSRSSRT